MIRLVTSAATACALALCACNRRDPAPAHAAAGRAVELPQTLDNQPVDPLQNTNPLAHVLLFVDVDCPISNRYAPEIECLQQSYAAQDFKFWLVYPDPALAPGQIRRHLTEYGLTAEALRDRDHYLVLKSDVRVTPEAAIFSRTGELVYRGRIDDRYFDLGQSRTGPYQHDLQEALEAIHAGTAVTPRFTRAIGCSIDRRR